MQIPAGAGHVLMPEQVLGRNGRESPMWVWRPVALAAALAVTLMAAACTVAEDVPALEGRAQDLNKAIMCPVCPGESIDQSQNPLAVQMRAIVMKKLEQGQTENQIKEFFVEGYGPSVLLEPPREGFTLVVWLLPPLALAGALLVLFLALRVMRRAPASQAEEIGGSVELLEEERDDYFRRIEAALDSDAAGGAKAKDDDNSNDR